ncbi:hypothetical protein H6F47_11935 [Sphaerospermopsis sp. FACHB-1094]|uniref:hypothetical protein n=1 Tax=Sphaerospermopsis sp. FACHB-1094 TaxID=2692861 RepID=UPI0016873583|nr:hypothetical protein [Sphaerospermopsis sp. FACHB-1094]MBD2133121.1 hypothetical protein [Sphaerospermopsis sp. FACHB-1094]
MGAKIEPVAMMALSVNLPWLSPEIATATMLFAVPVPGLTATLWIPAPKLERSI